MQESHMKQVLFLQGSVFFDLHKLHIVEKSVTQIIYLWPLPTTPHLFLV